MPIEIEYYDFGEMVVNGKKYTRDLIIFRDRIRPDWWRIEGHKLHIDDLKEVLAEKPDILVIGTGYSGVMVVPKETIKYLEDKGIKVIIKTTREAYKIFNELIKEGKNVAGAFHLTC
ncbi:MAG: Mth938-like domain-containing protein [Candidatus Asgardarchaeia archaeon]